MATTPGADTPRLPEGLLVPPGTYQVTLTVSGRSLTAPLEVKQDPRVQVPPEALADQHALWMQISGALGESAAAVERLRTLREEVSDRRRRLAGQSGTADVLATIDALEKKAAALEGTRGDYNRPGSGISRANADLADLATVVEGADAAPTAPARAVFAERQQELAAALAKLASLETREVRDLNERLRERGLPPVFVASEPRP
jgi:hypothetical protein